MEGVILVVNQLFVRALLMVVENNSCILPIEVILLLEIVLYSLVGDESIEAKTLSFSINIEMRFLRKPQIRLQICSLPHQYLLHLFYRKYGLRILGKDSGRKQIPVPIFPRQERIKLEEFPLHVVHKKKREREFRVALLVALADELPKKWVQRRSLEKLLVNGVVY